MPNDQLRHALDSVPPVTSRPIRPEGDRPAVYFHGSNNGKTARILLSGPIDQDIRIYVPNDTTTFATDADGVRSIMLITEDKFDAWWRRVKDWLGNELDGNLEETILNWVNENWNTHFQRHLDDLHTDIRDEMLNDNNNSLSSSNSVNIPYVHISNKPRGAIAKMHDLVNNLRRDLNTEINNRQTGDNNLSSALSTERSDRANGDDEIRSEILKQLPIGTVIALWKSADGINDDIREYYLKCDGSMLPNYNVGTTYTKLKQLLIGNKGSEESFNQLNYFFNGSRWTNKSLPQGVQIGAMVGMSIADYYRNLGYSRELNCPIPLTEEAVIEALKNENIFYRGINLPKKFPLGLILSNNFRSSSRFGVNNDPYPVGTSWIKYSPFKSSVINIPVDHRGVGDGYLNNDWSDTSGNHGEINHIDRWSNFNYNNFFVMFRREPGTWPRMARLMVSIGVGDSYTPGFDNSLELDTHVNTSSAGPVPLNALSLLLYIEMVNNDTNEICDTWYVLLPYQFLIGSNSPTTKEEMLRVWSRLGDKIPDVGPDYYPSMSANGMTGGGPVIHFTSKDQSTANKSLYIRIGCYCHGQVNGISTGDGYYKTSVDPVVLYSGDHPTSLWNVVHSSIRRYDGYWNYNYWKTRPLESLAVGASGVAYLNRFRIDTAGWLKFLGLHKTYTTEQWKTFWDELIASAPNKKWNPGNGGKNVYPRIGGVDITQLPNASTSTPSGFSGIGAFSPNDRGGNYAFGCSAIGGDSPTYHDPNSLRYHIRGCRTVIRLQEACNIHVQIDTNSTRMSSRNGYRGFLLHAVNSWKDIGSQLKTFASNGLEYNINQVSSNTGDANGNRDWGWYSRPDSSGRDTESAGIVRIRIYEEGHDEPVKDVMFVEFASTKDWCDGKGTGAGYETGCGYGIDYLNAEENRILHDFNFTPNKSTNCVIVIDRIHNYYNSYGLSSTAPLRADAWECFDMGWFIDYCENGNNLVSSTSINNSDVRLPNLSRDGVFIGGGEYPGTFHSWTVPMMEGGLSPGAESMGGMWGMIGYSSGWSGGTPKSTDGSGAPGFHINLDNSPQYSGHVNRSGKLYPDNYNVEYWIKFK